MLRSRLRAARTRLLSAALLLFASAYPAAAHEGHDHGAQDALVAADALPRGSAVSADLELVAVAEGETLTIYVDRFANNEPLADAAVEVEGPGGAQKAEAAGPGTYRVAAPWLAQGGHIDLIVTVAAGSLADVLTLSLDVPVPSAAPDGAGTAERMLALVRSAPVATAGASFLAGLLLAALLFRRGGRRAALALILMLGTLSANAHEGHDHGGGNDAGQRAPGGAGGELARRAEDGALFVPKSVQRIFGIRTEVARQAQHPRTVELPGRVIPDPNASGMVQSAVGGRLSPPPGGFPRLGAPVKEGDVLAYVTPPLQAIDVSDIRQRQGELDQQISIVERRVARQEQLATSGSVSKAQLDESKLELQGLRDRRAAIETARRQPEALIAPVSGVIAEGTAVAGQIVQATSVVFQIVDPARLWVEALSFEAFPTVVGASATAPDATIYRLAFRGAGLADRRQSIPIHFAVEGDAAGLRPGQFVTVLVARDPAQAGMALPKASVTRGANGQDYVFEHTAPERFVARAVRIAPLDGERVMIAAGVEDGARIVSQGAELLAHIR